MVQDDELYIVYETAPNYLTDLLKDFVPTGIIVNSLFRSNRYSLRTPRKKSHPQTVTVTGDTISMSYMRIQSYTSVTVTVCKYWSLESVRYIISKDTPRNGCKLVAEIKTIPYHCIPMVATW